MRSNKVKTGLVLPLCLVVVATIVATGFSEESTRRAPRLYDIQEQLTCNKPSETAKPGYPFNTLVDHYGIQEDVWISADPGTMAGEEAWLFVVRANRGRKLQDGDVLEDVTGNVERVFLEEGNRPNNFLIWKAPLDQGTYNVVIDFAPLGVYNRGVDIIDDLNTYSATGVGFTVAYPIIDYIRIDPLPGNNVVDGGCTRVQGTGQSQYWERYYAYGWSNGENGIAEDGGGDDINSGRVAALWATDVPTTLGSIDVNGIFLAAIDYTCGVGLVWANYDYQKITGETVTYSDTATIAVIPPDWIPGDSTSILNK